MQIFLDIDGVMVPAKGWKSPELLRDGFPAFSSKATIALCQIMSASAYCSIVLTTSHKSNYSLEEWKGIFERRGICLNNLDRLPDNHFRLSRKDELVNWFSANDADEFLILDDDSSLNELPAGLKDHWVKTSPYVGLTEEHVEVATELRSEWSSI